MEYPRDEHRPHLIVYHLIWCRGDASLCLRDKLPWIVNVSSGTNARNADGCGSSATTLQTEYPKAEILW